MEEFKEELVVDSWKIKLQELSGLIEKNRGLIESRFDMNTYLEFNRHNPLTNGYRRVSYSKEVDEVPACGCILGWGYHLNRGFASNFKYERNFINSKDYGHKVYEWSKDFLKIDEDTYDYLFSSSWGRDFNTLDHALKRMGNVLGGYVPEFIMDELKKEYALEGIEIPEEFFAFD